MAKSKKIVAIGGGTGTFTLLTGLRDYPDLDLTAIMTMVDDGGSNKVLRDEFGLLPTSGIRQAIVALAKDQSLLRSLFSYRYYQGVGISGMTFGNLFMAALADILGSQEAAIAETCKLLGVRGTILPISYELASLIATYDDGSEIIGQHAIDTGNGKIPRKSIRSLRTIPEVTIDPKAAQAIREADFIIIGPGDLYSNTIANLIVKGLRESIDKSFAKLIFVMNLMNKPFETYHYKATNYLEDLAKYLDVSRINHIVMNSDYKIKPTVLKRYALEESYLVEDDLGVSYHNSRIIRSPLISSTIPTVDKADAIKRSMIRHDPSQLGKVIYSIIQGSK